MDCKYVKYLNRPKRAKYNADSEIILQQILQASIWNSCLSFQQNERKPLSRKFFACVDKTNLRDEMKFDLKKVSSACGCVYRHQNCQKHDYAYNHITEKLTSKCKSHKNCNGFISKCCNINGNYLKSRKHHCSYYTNGAHHKLKNKHYQRHFPYVKSTDLNKKNNFFHLNHVVPFESYFQRMSLSNSGNLVEASSNHVLKADSLCSCETVPVPLVSCLYEKDCLSFLTRKALAIYLTLIFSLKNNKKEFDGKIAITSSLKKMVELLCSLIEAKPVACNSRLNHGKNLPSSCKEEVCSYFHYDKSGVKTTLEKVLKSNSISHHCGLFQSEKSLQLNEHLKEIDTNKEHDDYSRGGSALVFNNLLPSYCCHSVCGSYCSFQKKYEVSANVNINLSSKRISSRLQKKRDSGAPGPYSADYIVEVPVIKTKKTKLSHPYSHPLFWNFYNKQKESESRRWNALAMTYYKISDSHNSTDKFDKYDELSFLSPPQHETYSKVPGDLSMLN